MTLRLFWRGLVVVGLLRGLVVRLLRGLVVRLSRYWGATRCARS
mgnify:CR=1 FL=1